MNRNILEGMMAKRLTQWLIALTSKRNDVTRFQTTSAIIMDPELATAKSYDDIPQEKSFPLIGTTWLYIPFIGRYRLFKRHENYWKQYFKYGKIVREDMTPSLKFVHIFDVKDAEKIFRIEERFPRRMVFESVKFYREQRQHIYTNYGLAVENGERWHEIRSKVQKHMLRPASVHHYLPSMDSISRELVEKIDYLLDSNSEVPELMNELYKWSLESVASVAFDARLGCLRENITTESETWKLIIAVDDIFEIMLKLEYSPLKLWRFFPLPTITKFIKCMDIVSNAGEKYLKDAISKLENAPADKMEFTFLENLLLKEKMDMSHIVTMTTDMILGGIDTTSNASAWALYHLAKYPDCQQKLYEEICQILPDHSSPITASVLNKCRYLKAFLKETMRLSPTTTGNVRIFDHDIVLSGYRIPAGVVISFENQIVCCLEENFPEPHKFKPERWMRGMSEDKVNPFGFLPFGFGNRSCIGKRIAEQEIWILLIRIIQKYRLEYHYEDIHVYTKLVNTPDKPLRLTLIKR